MKREKVEIEYEGQKYEFYVRSLKFGEVNEVLRKSMGGGVVNLIGGDVPSVSLDIIGLTEMVVLKAVTHVDGRGLTKQELDELPLEVGQALQNKALELTPIFRVLRSEEVV